MINVRKFFIGSILLLSIGSEMACKKNLCEGVDCGQFGDCVEVGEDADCRCEPGFEKDLDGRCEIFSLSQYPGIYTATESCLDDFTGDTHQQSYTLMVSLGSSGQEIKLSNLGAQPCYFGALEVPAVVEGNDFVIRNGKYCQDAANQTEYLVSGEGSISQQGLSLSYHVTYSQFGTATVSQTCEVSLEQQ